MRVSFRGTVWPVLARSQALQRQNDGRHFDTSFPPIDIVPQKEQLARGVLQVAEVDEVLDVEVDIAEAAVEVPHHVQGGLDLHYDGVLGDQLLGPGAHAEEEVPTRH